MVNHEEKAAGRSIKFSILVLALTIVGASYFVDVLDLVLFATLRVPSLQDIGLPFDQITKQGLWLLNIQMFGLLVGGFFFGVIADRWGRKRGILGSITLFALATLANAFITSFPQYALCRFFAGVGLGGELGVSMTLVGEIVSARRRGWIIVVVATMGQLGAIAAGVIASHLDWRLAYIIGGGLGLVLLAGRSVLYETPLFQRLQSAPTQRGDVRLLIKNRGIFLRYAGCALLGLTIPFSSSFMSGFAPEIAKGLEHSDFIKPAVAIFYSNIGLGVGDIFWGMVSQLIQSRRFALRINIVAACIGWFLMLSPVCKDVPLPVLYLIIGFCSIPPALWQIIAVEQFGTDIRATATASINGIGRSLMTLFGLAIAVASTYTPFIFAVQCTAVLIAVLCVFAVMPLRETFADDLDYQESKRL